MKVKGIPLIWSYVLDENAQGFNLALLGTSYKGNFRGVNVTGLFGIGNENFDGVSVNGLCGWVDGSFNGVNINGVVGGNEKGGDFKGININGLVGINDRNFRGIDVNGLVSYVNNELYGISYGTLVNYAGTNGRIAIQIGGVNVIREYNPDGAVIQIGGYNTAGNQAIPVLNIRGWKNLKGEEKRALEQVVDEAKSDRKKESDLPFLIR